MLGITWLQIHHNVAVYTGNPDEHRHQTFALFGWLWLVAGADLLLEKSIDG